MIGIGGTLSSEMNEATRNINLQGRAAVMTGCIQATEGRLLTRGPGTRIPNQLENFFGWFRRAHPGKGFAPEGRNFGVQVGDQGLEILRGILDNTGKTVQMEAIA
jgi:hypothetical protein